MNSYYLQSEKRIQREIKLAFPHYRHFIAKAYRVEQEQREIEPDFMKN